MLVVGNQSAHLGVEHRVEGKVVVRFRVLLEVKVLDGAVPDDRGRVGEFGGRQVRLAGGGARVERRPHALRRLVQKVHEAHLTPKKERQ